MQDSAVYRVGPGGDVSLIANTEYPNGLAFSPDERTLYVADRGNHALRKVDPSGNVTTLAGGALTFDWVHPVTQAAATYRFSPPGGVMRYVAVRGEPSPAVSLS